MDMRIALTGFGNVGQGLATLIRDSGREYQERYGLDLLLTGVADRTGAAVDPAGLDPERLLRAKAESGTVAAYPGGVLGMSGASMLDSAQAHVLVEAASTNFEDAQPGWGYILSALSHDMDLVLASKGALVLHYRRLNEEARARGRRVLMAGTTGAPLPVIETYSRILVGVRVESFEGIVNGTTNVILTEMAGGLSYEEGVQAAQAAGVAETDPTLDVDGWDAAAKAVIIARALFDADLELDQVQRSGIRGITQADLTAARNRGRTIKLITRLARSEAGVRATVAPEERDQYETLGELDGQRLGMVFHTDLLGDVTCTIQETGGVPTAQSVLRDLVNLARERGWTSEQ